LRCPARAASNQSAKPLTQSRRIVGRPATEFRQVVREAAAGDDQHIVLPQRRQGASEAKVVRRTKVRLDRKLKKGTSACGYISSNGNPGAVVEAAAMIRAYSRCVRLKELCNPGRDLRARREPDSAFIERLRKSVEIMIVSFSETELTVGTAVSNGPTPPGSPSVAAACRRTASGNRGPANP